MNKRTTNALDDGQPLVEFAPLKPAEWLVMPRPAVVSTETQSEWKYVPVRRF